MTTIKDATILYVLNGNKSINFANLRTLLSKVSIPQDTIDSGINSLTTTDTPNTLNLDYPSLSMCAINKPTDFNIRYDMPMYNGGNSYLCISIIVDNANVLNTQNVKENASAEIIKFIDQPSEFPELTSKFATQICNSFDTEDLSTSPLLYGIMLHIPELKHQFDYFINHGDFDYNAISIQNVYNILKESLALDDVTRALFVSNLRPYDSAGALIDVRNADDNRQLWMENLLEWFDSTPNFDQVLDQKAERAKQLVPSLANDIDAGAQTLAKMYHKN